MDNISARDKFESAVIDLINDKSYLLEISGLVTKLPATKIPTLCVTFYKNNFFMFYNEDFVTRLPFIQLKAIIFHEYMHLMLNHLSRYKKYYDAGISPEILNISCDAAINQYLKYLPPTCIFPATFGAPEGYTFEQYTEFIINKFMNNVQKASKCKCKASGGGKGQKDPNGQGNDPGNSGGQGNDPSDENGDQDGQGSGGGGKLTDETKDVFLDDLFDKDNSGSHELWKDISEDDAEVAKEMIRNASLRAAGKMAGNMPGNLVSEIEAAWEEVINWKGALRYFYQSVIAYYREYSRSVRDRRRGIEVPGTKRGFECRLLFCTDNSGSMSDRDLEHVLSECRYLGKTLKVQADVLQFDYDIQDISEINKFVAERKFKGRGGTSFQEPFDFMQDRDFRLNTLKKLLKKPEFKKYDGIIIYTDGYAAEPKITKKMRILWLMTPGNKKPPEWPGRETEVKIKYDN